MRSIPTLCAALVALFAARAAEAQWTPVAAVPTTELFSMTTRGDTLAVGADTTMYVSTDAGLTWHASAKPVVGVAAITAAWVQNGRLYAGTFGQGAFVSSDLGASWSDFNAGLVGGAFDTQLDVVDFQSRGDSLYAATAGAGVYVHGFAPGSTWHHFGDVFEPNQASNVNALALGGTRLVATGGANGMVFRRDPGAPDWTISFLNNIGIAAGQQATGVLWTGTGWVVGGNTGVFRSVTGQEPWAFTNLGIGSMLWSAFAVQGGRLFGAFDQLTQAVIGESNDGGATWHDGVSFPGVVVEDLAIVGNTLYAARGDGLWRRSIAPASVPGDDFATPRFAIAGPQPFGAETRVRFELPASAHVSIRVFDALGRGVGERIDGVWPAGAHTVALDGRHLVPGVYTAVLASNGRRAALRLVHVR
jgi:hypothetical protein